MCAFQIFGGLFGRVVWVGVTWAILGGLAGGCGARQNSAAPRNSGSGGAEQPRVKLLDSPKSQRPTNVDQLADKPLHLPVIPLPPPRSSLDTEADSGEIAESERGKAEDANEPQTNVNARFDVLSYDLKGDIDWKRNALNARVMIKFKVAVPEFRELHLDSNVDKVTSVTWLPAVAGKVQRSEVMLPFQEKKSQSKLIVDLLPINNGTGLVPGESYFIKVNYVAKRSSNLNLIGPRTTDAVKSRVAYTTAEPLGAAAWMPCHNTPRDRAVFRAEFSMEPDESLVAPGKLDLNTFRGKKRVMRYSTSYSLPTYLMAFAVGQFQWSTTHLGKLPISVVYRRGAAVNASSQVKALSSLMAHFQQRLVNYPFEKYALVLLPEFAAGGIEHASVSFQAEHRSSDARVVSDFSLTAHELAHQWFGDLVTIANWDDLWIKEGLATLLAADALSNWDSPQQGNTAQGTDYYGRSFAFAHADAVRDPSLPPNQKYNSGPYERSAWVFTQLRVRLGEEKFWGFLRAVLQTNRMRAIGFYELQRELANFADASTIAAFNRAVRARKAPQLGFRLETMAQAQTRKFSVVVQDPQGALFVPFTFGVHRQQGLAAPEVFRVGGGSANEVSIELAPDDFLIWDSENQHAPLASFFQNKAEAQDAEQLLGTLAVPPRILAQAKADSGDFSILQQYFHSLLPASRIQAAQQLFPVSPAAFAALYARFHSKFLQEALIFNACQSVKALPGGSVQRVEWKKILADELFNPPLLSGSFTRMAGALEGCASLFADGQLGAIVQSRKPEFLSESANVVSLMQLASLQTVNLENIAYWRDLAIGAHSLRVRTNALNYLVNATPQGPEERQLRLAALKDVYLANRSSELMRVLWNPVLENLDPKQVLLGVSAILQDTSAYRVHIAAFCNGYRQAKTPELWEIFVRGLPPKRQVDEFLRPYFDNPQKFCGLQK